MLKTLDFTGKVAIVTGGGTGLGREVARGLADMGADVAVAGRRLGPIEETAREVEAAGRRSLAISTDVIDSTQVNNLIDRTISELGQIDIPDRLLPRLECATFRIRGLWRHFPLHRVSIGQYCAILVSKHQNTPHRRNRGTYPGLEIRKLEKSFHGCRR